MEALGAASSVIAVVELSAKVITLCFQYSTAVAGARDDIGRLQSQVKSLDTTLQHAKRLVQAPDAGSLSTSREVIGQLPDCMSDLEKLRDKLEPGKTRRAMGRVGFRALKWPFSSKEVESIVSKLERHQDILMRGLQIDQTTLLLDISKGLADMSIQSVEDTAIAGKPHFVMAFPPDPDYVDRPTIQTWISEQYAGSASRIALVGLGGFGKSQISIQFAHNIHAKAPGVSVFWVHGSTKATFEQSYKSLADTLMLPRRHDPSVDCLALVRDWLQRDNVTTWLMILDNADDMSVFFNSEDENDGDINGASYLPKIGGKILITSRNLSIAERLTSHKSIIKIPPMDSAQALRLFRNKLTDNFDDGAATELARTLDFVPLAINQAIAYINRRTPRVSIRLYLDQFLKSEKFKDRLLAYDSGDLRRHESVSNAVALTWQVTFEQIRQERSTAADLLSILSFFHPQMIPEYLFWEDDETDSEDGETKSSRAQSFEDDLDILRAYSLVNPSGRTGFLEMHGLVQFCTQRWLSKKPDDFQRWRSLFLSVVAAAFPTGDFETWPTCQILLPHVQPFFRDKPTIEEDVLPWSELLTNASWYLNTKGDHFQAGVMAQRAVDARTQLLGDEHGKTRVSKMHLACSYYSQERYKEAEGLQIEVLETVKKLFGEDNHNTAGCVTNLAMTYRQQGRLAESAALQVQAMETLKRVRGDEHPDTLLAIAAVGSVYYDQKRFVEAEALETKLLQTMRRVLGEDHVTTVAGMRKLAHTLRELGQLDKALRLMRECVDIRCRILGPDHSRTQESMRAVENWERERARQQENEAPAITSERIDPYFVDAVKLADVHSVKPL